MNRHDSSVFSTYSVFRGYADCLTQTSLHVSFLVTLLVITTEAMKQESLWQ